jgi:hypothetical protein
MRQRLYPSGHPNTLQSLERLAESFHVLGDETRASDLMADAVKMRRRLLIGR